MADRQIIIKKGVSPIIVILLLILLGAGAHMLLHKKEPKLEIVTVVDRTREIARLTTATYSEESAVILRKPRGTHGKSNVVVSRSYASSNAMDELCLILKAKVRAGFDLSMLKEQDLEVCPTGDTVTVTLDEVQIFDVTINPSDKTTFSRTGDWTDADERAAYDQIKKLLSREAVDAGLITRAKRSGEKQIADMFKNFGFAAVNIVYRKDQRDDLEKTLDGQQNLVMPQKE